MSATEISAAQSSAAAPGSLADAIGQRRRQRSKKREGLVTIPVNGFEDLFAAQYRRLTYEEKGDLARRHEGIGENSSEEVAAAADMLINACVDLLRRVGADAQGEATYESMGERWTAQTILRLFQLDLPDGVTSRTALCAALDSEDLMAHFLAFTRQTSSLDGQDQEALPGESEPSAEG